MQLYKSLAFNQHEKVLLKNILERANAKVKNKNPKNEDSMLRYSNKMDMTFHKKFEIKWEVPFKMVNRYANGTYHLVELDGTLYGTRINGYRLKKYFGRTMIGSKVIPLEDGFIDVREHGCIWFYKVPWWKSKLKENKLEGGCIGMEWSFLEALK